MLYQTAIVAEKFRVTILFVQEKIHYLPHGSGHPLGIIFLRLYAGGFPDSPETCLYLKEMEGVAMKPLRTMSVTLSLLIIAFFASVTICCGSPSAAEQPTTDEVKQKIQDAAQAIKAYSADQRDAAVKRVKVGLDALDERIDSLEARIDKEWDKMDQATRERSRAALKALRKKRNEVAEWYGAMKNSSSAAWEHIKKGFVNAYDALAVAWEKTEEEFKRSK